MLCKLSCISKRVPTRLLSRDLYNNRCLQKRRISDKEITAVAQQVVQNELETQKEPKVVPLANLTNHLRFQSKLDVFYPRTRHYQMFKQILDSEPAGIIPVIGPPNVGKTTFIRHMLSDRPVALIDLQKAGNISTVDQFIRFLESQFLNWGRTAKDISEKLTKYLGGIKAFGFEIPKDKIVLDLNDFNSLLKSIDEFLAKVRQFDPTKYPIVILDGSHRLRNLLGNPEGIQLLRAFFQWAVSTTKVEKACHFMITSEHGFFVKWLQHEFGLTFHLRTVTFSDLDKPRAHDFMKQYYNYKTNRVTGNESGVLAIESGNEEPLKNEIIEIPEPDYDEVFDMVGGHIFHLKLFLNDYISGVPPNITLANMIAIAARPFQEALHPETFPEHTTRGPVLWTRGQWLQTMKMLIKYDGVCDYNKLVDTTFDSTKVMDSMIYYGLVHYRPTHVAGVTDTERFYTHEPAIMVQNPAALRAMEHVVNNLPKSLITVRVRLVEEMAFYDIDMNEFTLEELKKKISEVLKVSTEQISSVTLLPDTQIYRDKDLLKLRHHDQIMVYLTGNPQNKTPLPSGKKDAHQVVNEDYSRAFGS